MMKIFPTSSIKQLDAYTIEHEPISSIDLMERAAQALMKAITERWTDKNTPFVIFAGPGNNGGDALALTRLLSVNGYRPEVYLFNPQGRLSEDCQINLDRLKKTENMYLHEISTQFAPPALSADHVVIDGLFGSGLNKPLSGGFAAVVKYINASPAQVIAIDIPSGLMGEDNSYNILAHVIQADLTLSMQLPKLAFLFAENVPYVGKWQLLDIGLSPEAIEQTDTDYALTENDDILPMLKPRAQFAHKGQFGHALLIAGSQGMAGASILAAKACLRSGVGLLTVHVPFCNNTIIQTAVPEAMTELDYSETCFSEYIDTDDYQAIAIGPGLGRRTETTDAVLQQIESCQTPMVIDADALNILGEHREYLNRLPQGSILTPHPKELERLVGTCRNSYERLDKARQLAHTAQAHIVLKGAYSAIITPEGKCWFNPTGNPGMATGGSGDVLTGILLALLAQGYNTTTAARLGVYIHGLAGDLFRKRQGMTGMIAGDLIQSLPAAWRVLEEAMTDGL